MWCFIHTICCVFWWQYFHFLKNFFGNFSGAQSCCLHVTVICTAKIRRVPQPAARHQSSLINPGSLGFVTLSKWRLSDYIFCIHFSISQATKTLLCYSDNDVKLQVTAETVTRRSEFEWKNNYFSITDSSI